MNGFEQMSRVNEYGFLERTNGGQHSLKAGRSIIRDWWLVKFGNVTSRGRVDLGVVSLPKEYVGKRIRFKIEIVE